jgi:uncharacterized protein (DUF58 family)
MPSYDSRENWIQTTYSPKPYLLAALSILFFLSGLFVSRPLMLVSIPFLLFLIFMILQSKVPETQVRVSRTLEKTQFDEHSSCKVKLRVENHGKHDIAILQIRDLIPSTLEADATQNGFTLELKAGEARDLIYELYANSFGIFSIGPVRLSISDIHGLYETQVVINLKSTVVVLPEVAERLSTFAIRPKKTKPWPGEISSRRTGLGMDYYSARPLVSGESLRRINWKASARSNDENNLYVNEYMAELGAEALIVVDARSVSEIGIRPNSTVSFSIRAAIAIADRMLRDRNRVGLITIGSRASRIPAGYGRRQFDRIVLALIDLRAGAAAHLESMARNLRIYYPNVSQLVLISPLIDDAAFAAAADISRARYDMIVVSPNPLDFESSKPKDSKKRERKISRNLADLERNANIDQLRSANVLVIDWKTSAPLQEVLEVYGRAMRKHFVQARR